MAGTVARPAAIPPADTVSAVGLPDAARAAAGAGARLDAAPRGAQQFADGAFVGPWVIELREEARVNELCVQLAQAATRLDAREQCVSRPGGAHEVALAQCQHAQM